MDSVKKKPGVILRGEVVRQIEESIKAKEALINEVDTLCTIAQVIADAFRRGNKVLLFGNGGSAADAEHIACELAGKFDMKRSALPAIALTTNTAILTSIANDFSYEEVFQRQLQGLVVKGDIVIGISTSGTSSNVLAAIKEAALRGAVTIAFTGKDGPLKSMTDYVLSVPSSVTPRIQEAHITAGHMICYLVEHMLFTNSGK